MPTAMGVCGSSFPGLPISPLRRIVMAPTVLVLLSPAHSTRLLSYGVLLEQVSDTTCSGVAKSAKVIAVKVLADNGCVFCLSPQSSPV